jgi:ubiquitin C-terminal hydrolase
MGASCDFCKACASYILQIKETFAQNGQHAAISTRQKNLVKLFEQKLREMRSRPLQQEPADALDQELSLMKQSIQEVQAAYAIDKAQAFSAELLEKIAELSAALKTTPAQAIKPPRRIYTLDDFPQSHHILSFPKAPISTKKDPLKDQFEADLTIDGPNFDLTEANLLDICGFENKGGNDCFQNALCQALLTKKFKENLIDRLPTPIRYFFQKGNMDSKDLRKAIIRHTSFKKSPNTQEDAHELFAALYNATANQHPKVQENRHQPEKKPQASFAKPTVADPSIQERLLSFIKRKHLVLQVLLYPFYFPVKLGCTILEKLGINLIKKTANEPVDNAVEEDSEILDPITEPLQTEANNLDFPLIHYNHYDVSTLPDHMKDHADFGGEEHKSQTQEKVQGLFQVEIDSSKPFDLQDRFNALFTAETTVMATIGTEKYTSHVQITKKLAKIPEAFALHVKRFQVIPETNEREEYVRDAKGNVRATVLKNFTPAENFCPDLHISKEHFAEGLCAKEQITMQLASFVVHKGSSISSGHYVAFRKVAGDWYYFNDSVCKKIEPDTAMQAAKHAYMYFFEKVEDVN